MDRLRPERLAKSSGDQVLQLARERVAPGLVRAEDDEAHKRLALQLVRDPDRRRLGDRGMSDQHRFDLRGTEALAGDLDRVVRAAQHVPETVLRVDVCPVAMDPEVFESVPVSLEVALAVAPEAARHA